ncbi:KTSC domain-containing protein [Rhizobium sp. KDH_Rht_773_N]
MSPQGGGQGGGDGGAGTGRPAPPQAAPSPAPSPAPQAGAAPAPQAAPPPPAQAAARPRMVRMELASRLIREIAYDPVSRILVVEHRLKGRRRYFDVPPAVVINLVSAPSPGWYYTQHIRDAFRREPAEAPRSAFSFPWFRPRGHRH